MGIVVSMLVDLMKLYSQLMRGYSASQHRSLILQVPSPNLIEDWNLDLSLLSLGFFNQVLYLCVLVLEVSHVSDSSRAAGVIHLNLPEWLLPIAHLVLPVVMLHYLLQPLPLVSVDDDIAQLLLRLDPIALVDVLNVHVNLQVYVQWIFRRLIQAELLFLWALGSGFGTNGLWVEGVTHMAWVGGVEASGFGVPLWRLSLVEEVLVVVELAHIQLPQLELWVELREAALAGVLWAVTSVLWEETSQFVGGLRLLRLTAGETHHAEVSDLLSNSWYHQTALLAYRPCLSREVANLSHDLVSKLIEVWVFKSSLAILGDDILSLPHNKVPIGGGYSIRNRNLRSVARGSFICWLTFKTSLWLVPTRLR
jgi:hypothetical protein